MARSIWHGAISFGLIYVPVDLFAASHDNTLPLHMLDSRDFSPIGFSRINKKTGKPVDWSHIVKGFEFKKGEYVALSDDDFRHANVKASETIAIETFCAAGDIPPLYYDTPYHLGARKGGQKVYGLLRQALQATGTVALATFVMRGRQHLCVVAPNDKSLLLQTLRFADEILPAAAATAADVGASKVSAAELAMAKQLIQGMTGKFNPAHFKDTYRADLKRRVKEKIKKKQTHSIEAETAVARERPKAQVIDLMAALKASLQQRGKAERRKPAAARRRA
jgi:DNA end-binding protein Ku